MKNAIIDLFVVPLCSLRTGYLITLNDVHRHSISTQLTNLFLFVLFCVLPVCYNVRLSHLNKGYLLTYLLTVRAVFSLHYNKLSVTERQ